MIDWQDIGVALIVAAAALYLFRKFFGRPNPKPTTTFVPLSTLKKPGPESAGVVSKAPAGPRTPAPPH